MNLGNPNALYLLILVPIFLFFLFINKRRRQKQLLRFCDDTLYHFHNKNFSFFYYNLKSFLLILAFLFIVLALARPQWDREVMEIDTRGQDLVFLIDVSKSMDATDINPTRLERAKMHISLFLDELRGDRVAIVAFAGSPVVICPLTTDYSAVKLLLSALSTETINNYGTNIALGLKNASELFNAEITAKTVILLSDGEEHEASAIEQAHSLASQGVTVYTIGIGTPADSPIITKNRYGVDEYAKDNKGNIVFTKLNIEIMHQIADITGGKFNLVSPNNAEIFDILKTISGNEKSEFTTKQSFRYKEQYHIFLILALLIFIIESLVNYKARETAS